MHGKVPDTSFKFNTLCLIKLHVNVIYLMLRTNFHTLSIKLRETDARQPDLNLSVDPDDIPMSVYPGTEAT
jgi:hypothetical protein